MARGERIRERGFSGAKGREPQFSFRKYFWIAHDRMADVRHMRAQLMGASGDRL
jgi:hypothetical protein